MHKVKWIGHKVKMAIFKGFESILNIGEWGIKGTISYGFGDENED